MAVYMYFTGRETHYILPFDSFLADLTIDNPSGLDALSFGGPQLQDGILGRAIRLDNRNQYIEVAGPGHRDECFGDLDKCSDGECYVAFSLQN